MDKSILVLLKNDIYSEDHDDFPSFKIKKRGESILIDEMQYYSYQKDGELILREIKNDVYFIYYSIFTDDIETIAQLDEDGEAVQTLTL